MILFWSGSVWNDLQMVYIKERGKTNRQLSQQFEKLVANNVIFACFKQMKQLKIAPANWRLQWGFLRGEDVRSFGERVAGREVKIPY